MPGLKGCLAVCSRPLGQQQRRPDGRTSCDDNAVHKVGECWQIAGAVYWQCQTVACRVRPNMMELCAGDSSEHLYTPTDEFWSQTINYSVPFGAAILCCWTSIAAGFAAVCNIGWHDRSWTISILNVSLLLTVTSNNFISPCRYIQWNRSYKIS